jgi:hypothetical protein
VGVTVRLVLSDAAVAALDVPADPDAAGARLRFLAAVKLYELHRVSVGSAAEIAGLEMAAFLAAFQALPASVQ